MFSSKNKNKEVSSINDIETGEPKVPSYFIPAALVTSLFFLWGFSYGLLDTLNKHFRNVLNICKPINIMVISYICTLYF